jgi:multidrug efflux pump subunit AcrB
LIGRRALLLSGKPLGFVAILGILALLGMITKNAVILIGKSKPNKVRAKMYGKRLLMQAAPASGRSC